MDSRILYTSRSLCSTCEAKALAGQARTSNARDGITGALYLADGRFLQYLEGQEDDIAALLERIERDPRHTDCKVLDRRAISRRIYADWHMAWLPASPTASLMLKTIMAQTGQSHGPDARTVGAFFYAMAQMGEIE
ncbi:MAG: BLUF domain-containing protein [Sphingomonas sp.]|nr:MAG: BLUF domain-containing protein [Sphingomonas sp.]